jgi:single-strand DNA-binding protein
MPDRLAGTSSRYIGGFMPNLNKVFLMGHLTRDVELKYTATNTAIGSFGLAVNTKGKDKDEVLFLDITAIGKQAEVISQYCKKGSAIFVEGRLRLQKWQDKEGNNKQRMDVVLSGFQFINGAKEKERFEDGEPF